MFRKLTALHNKRLDFVNQMLFYFYHLNIKGDDDFFIFPYTAQELFNFILENHLRWVEAVCLPLRAGLSSNSRATKNTSALIHCLTVAVSFVRGNNLYSPLSICENKLPFILRIIYRSAHALWYYLVFYVPRFVYWPCE